MKKCNCINCKFATVVEDSQENLLRICVCRESKKFLQKLDIAFDSCEKGEREDDR